MGLVSSIGEELKLAMKSGDTKKRDTLRLLQSAIKNVAIEKRREAASLMDQEVIEIIKRLVKQRKDSIEQYTAGRRQDLVAQEQVELDLLAVYLPDQLSREATEKIVERVLATIGAVTTKDMGRVMGAVMQAAKEEGAGVDGGIVRAIVATHLESAA